MKGNNELYDQIHREYFLDKGSYLNKSTLVQEILDYLEREIAVGSRILELGSGGGHLAHYLQTKGYDVLSTDYSQVALDVAKLNYPNLKLCLIDAEDMLLEDENFDVIIAIEVIEHLPRLNKHILEARRVLKAEGIYIIKTPNKWLNILFNRIQPKESLRAEHVSLCSIGDIHRLLSESGFCCRFLRQRRLTDTQINKLKLLMPQVVVPIIAFMLNSFLRVAPLSFMPSIICIARKVST